MRGLPSFLSEDMDTKVALIQSLVPLGLMAINDMLQREVTELAGNRHQRDSALCVNLSQYTCCLAAALLDI